MVWCLQINFIFPCNIFLFYDVLALNAAFNELANLLLGPRCTFSGDALGVDGEVSVEPKGPLCASSASLLVV